MTLVSDKKEVLSLVEGRPASPDAVVTKTVPVSGGRAETAVRGFPMGRIALTGRR